MWSSMRECLDIQCFVLEIVLFFKYRKAILNQIWQDRKLLGWKEGLIVHKQLIKILTVNNVCLMIILLILYTKLKPQNDNVSLIILFKNTLHLLFIYIGLSCSILVKIYDINKGQKIPEITFVRIVWYYFEWFVALFVVVFICLTAIEYRVNR